MTHIIILGADSTLESLIHKALRGEDYHIEGVPSLDAARPQFDHKVPDLIIIEASRLDGRVLCEQLRANLATTRLPILFLTNGDESLDVAAILNAGGDDHLRQPFAERELAARVRALLRRAAASRKTALTLEPATRSVLVGGRRAALTSTEYDLLTILVHHRGKPLSAEALLRLVWHYPPGSGDLALVRNHVHNLREKIEEDPDRPSLLISRHGRGYMLVIAATAAQTMPSAFTLG